MRPGEQQAVHAVLPRPGRQPQQLDAAHPLLPPPAAAPLARPGRRPAPGRGHRHLEGRRQPPPLPDPYRRQHRRADDHRRQGPLPLRGRPRPLPHRGRPRRGAAHRLDGPRLPVQAAPAARGPHRARHLQDPARRHRPRPGEHQRRPAPRPVPRHPRQGRRLRRRRGHQRDRPLRRQLAQAGSLHRHDVVRRVGVRPEGADRRGRPEDRRHRRPGPRPGTFGELLGVRRGLPGRQRLGRRRAPQRRRPSGQGLPGQPGPRARRGRHLQRAPDEHVQPLRASLRGPDRRPRAGRLPMGLGPGRPRAQRQPRAGPATAEPADHEPHRHPAQGRPGQAHRRPRGQLAAAVAHRRRPGHPDGAQLDRAVRGRRRTPSAASSRAPTPRQ